MDQISHDRRVLVLAPLGRDGPATAELLRRIDIDAAVCSDLPSLVHCLDQGAAAVFLAEEALFGKPANLLTDWIERQPAWSDLPFIVLSSHQEQRAVALWRQKLVESLRNVTLLERPIQGITLTSSVQAALRARARQYEVRSLLEARDRAARELEGLVAERTRALQEANSELRTQMRERAKVEETLRQAQKIEAIGQLTGGVAHDFNNLLTVILGGLELLKRQAEPAKQARLIDGMQQAAQRGAGLTRQLLTFSRRQALQPEAVDLERQIGGMRELLDRSLRGDVHVALEFSPELWPIKVDPGELELVVLNLAVNARDAMPKGGTIVIHAENMKEPKIEGLAGEFVRLSVIDTGTGMSPEVRARVFEPYFTTKEVGKGSGLGLAQVYGFATQSGGTVQINSEIGRGTTIALYLPRSTEMPESEPHHLVDLHPEERQNQPAETVLLVEDDNEVAQLVGQMLDQLGYRVLRAATGEAALGALANGRAIDLVFSDIMMPGGMNGIELANEIMDRRPGLPILLTSGYSEGVDEQARARGIRILPKPYRLDELSAALSSLSLGQVDCGKSLCA